MFQAGLKVYSFVYCFVILAALSDANIMSEIEFSTVAVVKDDALNDYVFETYTHVDIVGCVRECKALNTCKFINYNKVKNLCTQIHYYVTNTFLIPIPIVVDKKKARENVCWLKLSDISDIHAYFGFASNTCASETICEVQYCEFKRPVSSFEHYGNMYAVGSKQAYSCLNHSTNTMYKQIDVCEPNGNWSLKSTPCSYTDAMLIDGRLMVYYISDVRVSQSEAAKRCEKENAHLLRATTEKKFDDLSAKFGDVNDVWIDAHREEAGSWRTSDGQEIDNAVRDFWGFLNFFGDKSCATTGSAWRLYPLDCSSNERYICETDA